MTTASRQGRRRQGQSDARTAPRNIATAATARTGATRYEEVNALHQRCGVYTRPEVVREILDAVGWHAGVDLSGARLLEPAAGNGAFLGEAARRLIASLRQHRRALTAESLVPRIRAYELHRREAARARAHVQEVLHESGVHHRTAAACARHWIVTGDFLLAESSTDEFTHAVGNPPYVRWSKIPEGLKARYERHLSKDVTGGDLFLPFLDRALDLLRDGGRCGFICSDRWRYMAFAQRFREQWLPRLDVSSERTIASSQAFVRDVGSYPSIFVATKRPSPVVNAPSVIVARGTTLREAGYTIRVGPALGCTSAFVLGRDEDDVEPALLHPWIDASELDEGAVRWGGRRVVAMHAEDGRLIDPARHPGLLARLKHRREVLSSRYVVKHGAPWYAPIDRVRVIDWARPKLLVPELARTPRCAVDRSGAIPSHGVYAIFAPNDDDIDSLYGVLRDGGLAARLEHIAPRVKGGYVRCYGRFLAMIPIGD